MVSPLDYFKVRSDRRNGVVRVVLEGELDLATVPILEEHLSSLEPDGVAAELIDLRDLTFIDSAGLRALFAASNRARDNGHRFAVVGASEPARGLFRLSGADRLLHETEGMRLLESFTNFPTPPSRDGDRG